MPMTHNPLELEAREAALGELILKTVSRWDCYRVSMRTSSSKEGPIGWVVRYWDDDEREQILIRGVSELVAIKTLEDHKHKMIGKAVLAYLAAKSAAGDVLRAFVEGLPCECDSFHGYSCGRCKALASHPAPQSINSSMAADEANRLGESQIAADRPIITSAGQQHPAPQGEQGLEDGLIHHLLAYASRPEISSDVQHLFRCAAEALTQSPAATPPATVQGGSFQDRVQPWMMACFGPEISADRLERADRFIEEALELVQSGDYPKERAHQLVEYVYGRDQGDINQEVGGVMVTLAAYCLAFGIDMHAAAETELARIWTKVEKIREKQASKPRGSALPIASPAPPVLDDEVVKVLGFYANSENYFSYQEHGCTVHDNRVRQDGGASARDLITRIKGGRP